MKVVIIPAYQPDGHLTELVENLRKSGFVVLVVDDGSKEKYQSVFKSISKKAMVIHSPCNEGKGAALKKGILVLKEFYPKIPLVIEFPFKDTGIFSAVEKSCMYVLTEIL